MGYRLLTGRILLSIAVFVNYSMFGQRLPYDNPTRLFCKVAEYLGLFELRCASKETQGFPYNKILESSRE